MPSRSRRQPDLARLRVALVEVAEPSKVQQVGRVVLEDRDLAVVLVDRVEGDPHRPLELGARVGVAGQDLVVLPEQLLLERRQDLVDHRLLGVEVVVEAAGQDAGGVRDVADRGVAEALLREEARRRWRAARRGGWRRSAVMPAHGLLAAHGDDLAGHVRRVVAGEEDHHVRDLPRLGGPAERLALLQLGEQLVGGDLGQERVHRQARADRVDADAVRRQVDRRAPGQRHHAGLRGGVVRLPLLGAPADDRGVVDDHALLARPRRTAGRPPGRSGRCRSA